MFKGTFTALITPFINNQVDYISLEKLIQHQLEAKITGLVPAGTTGESPTLDCTEHLKVIQKTVEFSQQKATVIAGTGANSTQEAIHLTRETQQLGVDASLQVCPYYNKPSQEGLYRHFSTIADSSDLPLVLYSIPGRSVIEISVDTVARLAKHPNIVGIKEAGGSVERINQLAQIAPTDFCLLSGDDPLTLPFMAAGAQGLVSVTSNLIPHQVVELVNFCQQGDFQKALTLQKRLYPLFNGLMSLDTNPVPIKSALAVLGRCQEEFRLPLAPLATEAKNQLQSLLKQYQLI